MNNKKMKLQVAMDTISPDKLEAYLENAKEYLDIVELGTPYLLVHGVSIIHKIKKIAPHIEILCDSKIMDAGYYEAEELFKSGADYVTVLAVADNSTIKECVRASQKYGKTLVADMICIEDVKTKAEQLEALGVAAISVHTGVDQQAEGRTPLDDLAKIKEGTKKAQVFVAGGLTKDTIKDYMEYQPEVLIVGGGILNAEDPVEETRLIYHIVNQ
ncbi:MAG: 3-hexulose-6-phosphate synthase [Blautia sp.]|jgi:3-hexulose-6-phosphate synthase